MLNVCSSLHSTLDHTRPALVSFSATLLSNALFKEWPPLTLTSLSVLGESRDTQRCLCCHREWPGRPRAARETGSSQTKLTGGKQEQGREVLLLNVTRHGDTHKLGTSCCRFRKPVYQLAMLNQAISSIELTPVLPSTHLKCRQCPCARRSCQAPLRWGCSQHREPWPR